MDKTARSLKSVPVDGVNPGTRLDLGTKGLEGELSTEGIVSDVVLGVNVLDEGRDDADVRVRGSSRNQNVVRMPGDVQDGRVVKLDVLRNPPIVVLIEVADSNDLGAGSDGELVLTRRPGAASGRTVDTQQDQSGVPGVVLKAPDISVTILRARKDTVVLVAPGEGSNDGIMLSQSVDQVELSIRILVDLNGGIIRAQGEQGAVSVPGVSGNRDGQTIVRHDRQTIAQANDFLQAFRAGFSLIFNQTKRNMVKLTLNGNIIIGELICLLEKYHFYETAHIAGYDTTPLGRATFLANQASNVLKKCKSSKKKSERRIET